MFKNLPRVTVSARYKGLITLYCIGLAIIDTWGHKISPIAAGAAGLAVLPWMFDFVEKISLPGGFELVLKRTEDILKEIATDPVKENVQKHAFLAVYENDPQLALAGLRIEIEKRLRTLADKHMIESKRTSLLRLARELADKGIISPTIASVLHDMLPSLNQAVHAQEVTPEAGDWVIRNGPRLLAAIDDNQDFPFNQQDEST